MSVLCLLSFDIEIFKYLHYYSCLFCPVLNLSSTFCPDNVKKNPRKPSFLSTTKTSSSLYLKLFRLCPSTLLHEFHRRSFSLTPMTFLVYFFLHGLTLFLPLTYIIIFPGVVSKQTSQVEKGGQSQSSGRQASGRGRAS